MNEEQALPQAQPPSRPKVSHQVIVILIIVLTIIGLILIFQGGSGLKTRQGRLVGVATADGIIRYGELVLADSKSVILRNVFVSRGYFTPPEEDNPTLFYQVDPERGTGADIDSGDSGTVVIPRNQVLFMTSDVADFAAEAVRGWTPTPFPTPPSLPPSSPEETPAPIEEGEEGETEMVEELPTPEETTVSTVIPAELPIPTPEETPVVTPAP
jgi:hypothetical protein